MWAASDRRQCTVQHCAGDLLAALPKDGPRRRWDASEGLCDAQRPHLAAKRDGKRIAGGALLLILQRASCMHSSTWLPPEAKAARWMGMSSRNTLCILGLRTPSICRHSAPMKVVVRG